MLSNDLLPSLLFMTLATHTAWSLCVAVVGHGMPPAAEHVLDCGEPGRLGGSPGTCSTVGGSPALEHLLNRGPGGSSAAVVARSRRQWLGALHCCTVVN